MANILLIDTNTTPFNEAFPVYPTGLDYLQGALKEKGMDEAHILDLTRMGGPLSSPNFKERKKKSLDLIKKTVSEGRWDIIGLSLRNIDSTYPVGDGDPGLHYYLPDLMDYIDCATGSSKAGTPIVLGGTGFTMAPEVLLKDRPDNCYGVIGPGESSFPGLVEKLLNGASAEAITRTCEPSIGKLQNRALIREYLSFPLSESTFGIRTKIGCGQHCGYCPYPIINGREQHFKKINIVLEELDLIRTINQQGDTPQPMQVMFADDIFNRPGGHAKDILKAMLDNGLILASWHAYLDPKNIDEEFMELVFQTNGWRRPTNGKNSPRTFFFSIDIESGSATMLKHLQKPYTVSDLISAAEAFKRVAKRYKKRTDIAAINLGLHVLLGYPGECEETIKETCQLINAIKPAQIAFQLGVRVYPQTPLAQKTKGTLWHQELDLAKPVFATLAESDVLKWLDKHLNPRYCNLVQKGNMILISAP
ncbi:B12-binding domain-containing radical SAM protein [Thermodesulfobacteriota bacterium]